MNLQRIEDKLDAQNFDFLTDIGIKYLKEEKKTDRHHLNVVVDEVVLLHDEDGSSGNVQIRLLQLVRTTIHRVGRHDFDVSERKIR